MHSSDSDSVLSESLSPDTLDVRSMVPDACRDAPDTLDTFAMPPFDQSGNRAGLLGLTGWRVVQLLTKTHPAPTTAITG